MFHILKGRQLEENFTKITLNILKLKKKKKKKKKKNCHKKYDND